MGKRAVYQKKPSTFDMKIAKTEDDPKRYKNYLFFCNPFFN